MLRKYQADSQQALDNLFNDKLIPFKLIAEKVTDERFGEFTVHFYDSRLRSVSIVLKQGASFMDQTRAEVLSRLKNVRNLPLAVRHAI
ncbi:MAG: hypothetical protein QOE77_3660 [Blastocatellia bacterium]|nr:hypothetical protein [Blastocatellia bacterium]